MGVGLRQGFCISPAILEFTLYTRLALNPQRSACLCLPLASPVLGSKVCDTTAWSNFLFLISHLLEVNQQGHMSIVLEHFFRYERNYDPNLIQILKIQSVSRSTKKKINHNPTIKLFPSTIFKHCINKTHTIFKIRVRAQSNIHFSQPTSMG